jgi:hypothetical protein
MESQNLKTAFNSLPEKLLDNEGYPTPEWIEYIKNYVPDKSLPIIDFVKMILIDGWYMSDWGFVLKRQYRGKIKIELHTGGWSGNEEIIDAIKSNIQLTHGKMKYVSYRMGGHHYFEIKVF